MNLTSTVHRMLRNPLEFFEHGNGIRLRRYQQEAALAIIDSVKNGLGLTFVVIFPRQSGKNELQAQLETYILACLSTFNAEIVKISPTWKPQALNAMRRLERTLNHSLVCSARWSKESGFIYRLDKARIYFLSGSPTANIVGATANALLECDEAQDILIAKWDKEVNPMAASTNATRVFWGTAWTSRTLLAREMRAAQEAERRDGIRRVFRLTADDVAAEVPAYGKFVAAEIAKLGRQHPFVRTQYYSEEIDAEGGMFPPARQALMRGDHPPQLTPSDAVQSSGIYLFTLDVAGSDETRSPLQELAPGEGPGEGSHDSTVLTVFSVDLSTLRDPAINAATYRVVWRRQWNNVSQNQQYAELRALIDLWQPLRVVIDATGIGAGLYSFLSKAYPEIVQPFVFTQKSKSDLGWAFIAICETGRFKDYDCTAPAYEGSNLRLLQRTFEHQLDFTALEVLPGPGRLARWSVPDGVRHPETGEPLHDDLILSAALIAALEDHPWGSAESAVVQPFDPLHDLTF